MDWKDALGKVIDLGSPLVSALVPGGPLISYGIKALASAFGLKESEVTPGKINELMMQDKDFALKIKMADQAFSLELIKADNARLQTIINDVQNARNRQIESEKATGKRDYNLYILAWVIMGGFFGMIMALIVLKMFFPLVNLSSDPLLSLLLGSLSTDAGMVVGYFFGSSRSSAEKTELLAKAPPIIP